MERQDGAGNLLPEENGISHALTYLKALPPTDLITKRKLAALFGVKERTVQRMVARHDLPPASFGKCGAKRWLAGHVVEWVTDRLSSVYESAKAHADKFRAFVLF